MVRGWGLILKTADQGQGHKMNFGSVNCVLCLILSLKCTSSIYTMIYLCHCFKSVCSFVMNLSETVTLVYVTFLFICWLQVRLLAEVILHLVLCVLTVQVCSFSGCGNVCLLCLYVSQWWTDDLFRVWCSTHPMTARDKHQPHMTLNTNRRGKGDGWFFFRGGGGGRGELNSSCFLSALLLKLSFKRMM